MRALQRAGHLRPDINLASLFCNLGEMLHSARTLADTLLSTVVPGLDVLAFAGAIVRVSVKRPRNSSHRAHSH